MSPNAVVVANLTTAFNNISAAIASITANPKPTYTENGRNVPWTEYLSMLIEKQETLLKAIQNAGGPFDVVG